MKTEAFAGSIKRTHPQATRFQALALLWITSAAAAMLIASAIDGSAGIMLDPLLLFAGPVIVGAGLAYALVDATPSLSWLVSIATALGALFLFPFAGLFALGDFLGGFVYRPCSAGEQPENFGYGPSCIVSPLSDRIQLPIHIGVVALLPLVMVFSFQAVGAIARESGWRAKKGAPQL